MNNIGVQGGIRDHAVINHPGEAVSAARLSICSSPSLRKSLLPYQ
jgi:hypothetical protein